MGTAKEKNTLKTCYYINAPIIIRRQTILAVHFSDQVLLKSSQASVKVQFFHANNPNKLINMMQLKRGAVLNIYFNLLTLYTFFLFL